MRVRPMNLRYASAAAMLLAFVAWPSAGWSKQLGCVSVTEGEIAGLVMQWLTELNNSRPNDPDKVVNLYDPDASLLPTVVKGPLLGRGAIRDYFVGRFLPPGPIGTIDGEPTVRIGCNVAFAIGLYNFRYRNNDPPTPARYTFVYEYSNGGWLIVHQHSSKQP
jgi:uncharacterized protein (TIGR02246 family)